MMKIRMIKPTSVNLEDIDEVFDAAKEQRHATAIVYFNGSIFKMELSRLRYPQITVGD